MVLCAHYNHADSNVKLLIGKGRLTLYAVGGGVGGGCYGDSNRSSPGLSDVQAQKDPYTVSLVIIACRYDV